MARKPQYPHQPNDDKDLGIGGTFLVIFFLAALCLIGWLWAFWFLHHQGS